LWGEKASSETKIGELDVPSAVDEEILGLEITMDVSKLMQGVDAEKHLRYIESGMSVVENPSVVEQSAEVAAWDIFLDLA
jgi:hypothetical protein